MIKTSLDWNDNYDGKRSELAAQLASIPYNHDLRKMLINIDDMVKKLSSLEVEARRTKKMYNVEEQLSKINSSIVTIEQFIMLAILMR